MPKNQNIDISHQKHSGVNRSLIVLYGSLAITIGSFYPASSKINFIEFKTTVGGLTLIKSITQNPFIAYLKKCMQCLSGNIRPNVISDNAVKNIQDIEIYPKG
jgi:hypothetical protein